MWDAEAVSRASASGAASRSAGATIKRGGRVLLTEMPSARIARLASNCSIGNRLSDFDQRISSKSSS